MNELLSLSPTHIVWMVWLVWVLIGVFGALAAQRFSGRHTLFFDMIIAIVASCLGGYLSTCFLGDTPLQLFLISVLAAIFFAAGALWLTIALIAHFSRKE